MLPVSAQMSAEGVMVGNGISFDDFARMQVHNRPGLNGHVRRLSTPDWAMNDKKLQQVVIEYLFQRVHAKLVRATMPKNLTPIEQVYWAETLLRSRLPQLEKTVDALCGEYVALRRSGADPIRLRKLESSIGSTDSAIIFLRAPARCVAATVYLYYRTGVGSVGVGEALGLHPPAVRQLLRRICKAATACGFPPPEHNRASNWKFREKKKPTS